MSQQHSSSPASEALTLYEQALRLLLEGGEISASLIQRRLSVGYVQAREVLDRMVAEGVITVYNYIGKPIIDVQAYMKEVENEV